MTAADAREQLEAAIWRVPAHRHKQPLHDLVTAALAAADAYAVEMVAGFLDQQTRELRAYDRRERLAEAAAENYGGNHA